MMNLIHQLMHIDQMLFAFVAHYGALTYIILFIIIFAETGLVVTPFLPGDSLLFVAGSIAARSDNALNINLLFIALIIASTLGNKVNYLIGRAIGPRIFTSKRSWFFNKKYLTNAHLFYAKHGGKAIIFARFIPILRTLVPFVAGIGAMRVSRFSFYNALSATLWISALLGMGYCLGTLPILQNHFSLVIYGIVGMSLLPVVIPLTRRLIA